MHCLKGTEVWEFLANLSYKREELAAAEVLVTNDEYQRTILKGIPGELATFMSHLLSLAMLNRTLVVNLDTLVNQICEEADRLKSRCTKGQGGKKDSSTDEV